MTSTTDRPSRHSIRLKEYDYSQAGAYFITTCVNRRECLFGEIVNGEMELNGSGQIVVEEWTKTENVRKNVILDAFVVMPNHFHGIMFFLDNAMAIHQQGTTRPGISTGLESGSIGSIMAQFKSIVTKRINRCRNNIDCGVWQRNYYERVIRNEDELSRAREYIVNNPLKWELDQENPENC